MTDRKPSSVSFPDWVEHRIRQAQERGAFDNLPGAGKPIPSLDRPQHELSWVADYLHREDADVAALLPPSLALAKEVELLPDRLAKERSEARVRDIVADLNRRIRMAHLAPQVGPPMRVRSLDVEEAVGRWRTARRVAVAAAPPSAAPPAPPARLPRRALFRRPRRRRRAEP